MSDEDVSNDESDNKVSGSGFTSGSCLFSCIELSVDRFSGLLFKVVTKSVYCVCGISSVSRSKNYLVSSLEFLI